MLRRQTVDDRQRLAEVPRHHHGPVAPDGGLRDGRPRQGRALPADRGHDARAERSVVGQTHGPRHRVVLGLGEEVRGHVGRLRRAVRDHDDLARAGDQIDADIAEDEALGERDVEVPRPDDLVDGADGRRSIRERGHGLGAAQPVDLGRPGEAGRGQHRRGHAPVPARRRDHHQIPHARHACGDQVHQHGGRVGRGPAGDVAPHPVERRHLLAEKRAVLVAHPPGAGQLMAVECLDPPSRLGEGRLEPRGDRRGRPLVLGNPELLGAQLHPVEALREVEQRGIAAPPHLVDDRHDPRDGVGVGRRVRPGERRHDPVGRQLRRLEEADHGRPRRAARPAAGRRRGAPSSARRGSRSAAPWTAGSRRPRPGHWPGASPPTARGPRCARRAPRGAPARSSRRAGPPQPGCPARRSTAA